MIRRILLTSFEIALIATAVFIIVAGPFFLMPPPKTVAHYEDSR